jgi:U3 small nucleolar RNA-associated protein 11
MSTLRNTIQRRNHRERAQPAERQKWGILEKSKDYKLRAADHKLKRRKIKALQQKASERNEDEFYFGMMSSQSQGGVKVAQRGEGGGSKVLKRDVVDLMKTQDVGYLRTVLQQTKSEREKVGREVVSEEMGVKTAVAGGGRRKVFGDDDEEVVVGSVPAEEAGEDDVDGWSTEDEDADEEVKQSEELSPEEQRKRRKHEVRRRKLQALKEREQDLTIALREVEDQRAKMNGTMGGVNKNGVKFKVRQRQR